MHSQDRSTNAGQRLLKHVQRVTNISVLFGQQTRFEGGHQPAVSEQSFSASNSPRPLVQRSMTNTAVSNQQQSTVNNVDSQPFAQQSTVNNLPISPSPNQPSPINRSPSTNYPVTQLPNYPVTQSPIPPPTASSHQASQVQRVVSNTAVSPQQPATVNSIDLQPFTQRSTVNNLPISQSPNHPSPITHHPSPAPHQPITQLPSYPVTQSPINHPTTSSHQAPQMQRSVDNTAVSPQQSSTVNYLPISQSPNHPSPIDRSSSTNYPITQLPSYPISQPATSNQQPTTNTPQSPINRHPSNVENQPNSPSSLSKHQSPINQHPSPEIQRAPEPNSAAMNPNVQKYMAMSSGPTQTNLPWSRLQAVSQLHRRTSEDTPIEQDVEMPWERNKRLKAEAQNQPQRKIVRRSALEEVTPGKKKKKSASPIQRVNTPNDSTAPLQQIKAAETPHLESSIVSSFGTESDTQSTSEPAIQRSEEPTSPPSSDNDSSDTVSRPLEEMWPVQRLESPANMPQNGDPETVAFEPPVLTPPPPEKPSASAQLARQLVQQVDSEKQSNSSIDYVMPTRPRPKVQRKRRNSSASSPTSPNVESEAEAPSLNSNSANTPPIEPTPTMQRSSSEVQTEIGALPGDLWELVGDTPPSSPSTSQNNIVARSNAQESPAHSSPIQRHVPPSQTNEHPATAILPQSPAPNQQPPTIHRSAGNTAVSQTQSPNLPIIQNTAVSHPQQTATNGKQQTAINPQPTTLYRSTENTAVSQTPALQHSSTPALQHPTSPSPHHPITQPAHLQRNSELDTPSPEAFTAEEPSLTEDVDPSSQVIPADIATAETVEAQPQEMEEGLIAFVTEEQVEGAASPILINRHGVNEEIPLYAESDTLDQLLSITGTTQEESETIPLHSTLGTAEESGDSPIEVMVQPEDEPETAVAYADQNQLDDILTQAETQEEDGVLPMYADEDTATAKAGDVTQIQLQRDGDENTYMVFVNADRLDDFLSEAEAEDEEDKLTIFATEEAIGDEVEHPSMLLVQQQGEREKYLVFADPDQLEAFLAQAEMDEKGPSLIAYAEEEGAEADLENPIPVIMKRLDGDEICIAHIDEEEHAEFLEAAEQYDANLLIEEVSQFVYTGLKRRLRIEHERLGR
ncbi:MAG: hypothetical protein AAF490_00570 [Chloroflexota bacterium]